MTWKTLSAQNWFFSPKLEGWQKKILSDLRARAPREKNISWILSSGTQSLKSVKAIALSHESILCSAEAVNKHLRSTRKDLWLLAIPHYHIGGLSIFARAYLSGAKVVEYKSRWNPAKFAAAVADEGISLTSLVPTQVHDLVTAKIPAPPSLRAAVIGGGALQPSLYLQARALGWPVLPSYGLTECCSQVATASLASLREAAYPALQILKHVDVELREQRIFIKSKSLCRWIAIGHADGRYSLEDPRREGWFATEDAAEWVGNGLKILGRRDDVVKVLGLLIPVQEIEQRAREFFSSAGWNEKFCVIPQSEARIGHRFVLITDSNKSLREWEKHLSDYNSGAQGPYRIQSFCWVPQVPTNEMGKIKKTFLSQDLFG